MAINLITAHHPIYQNARMEVRAMRELYMNPLAAIQNYVPVMSDAYAASLQQAFVGRLVNFCNQFQTMAGLIMQAQGAGVAHYNDNFITGLVAANARVAILTANAMNFTFGIEELYQLSDTYSDPYNMGGTYEQVAYQGVFAILLAALLVAFAAKWGPHFTPAASSPMGGITNHHLSMSEIDAGFKPFTP
jgi:hypothetical protein